MGDALFAMPIWKRFKSFTSKLCSMLSDKRCSARIKALAERIKIDLLEAALRAMTKPKKLTSVIRFIMVRWGSLVKCCERLRDLWPSIVATLQTDQGSTPKAIEKTRYLLKEANELKGLVFFMGDFDSVFSPTMKNVQETSRPWIHLAFK